MGQAPQHCQAIETWQVDIEQHHSRLEAWV